MPHIISVDDKKTFKKFLEEGYIGVRLPIKFYKEKEGNKKVSNLLATIYDIFADLKRVKIGDDIFIHVKGEQKIYGVFKAVSPFKENPDIPENLRSGNLIEEDLTIEELLSLSQINDYFWQVSIKPHDQLYFEEGFNANEVFKLKDLCKGIWTIPERWKYEDKEKTVRPLTPEEGKILIELLRRANPDESSNPPNIKPKNLNSFRQIELPLKPDKNGYIRHEKLLEAWIVANAYNPEDMDAYNNIKHVFGNFDFIANTIRAYYIKFMDIFGYAEKEGKRIYKIIELKRGKAHKNDCEQLAEYIEWIDEFLCRDTSNKVKGFLVAKDFTKPVKNFVKNLSLNIQLVRYELYDERVIFKSGGSGSLSLNYFY